MAKYDLCQFIPNKELQKIQETISLLIDQTLQTNLVFITIISIVSFSGSVDTIVFFKTGNHLPQCLWFSNSFFTVDGCIDCVKGILESQVSIS